MTLHRLLNPKANVSRLCVKRNDDNRGLISIDQYIRIEKRKLVEYLINSDEDLMQYVCERYGCKCR